MRIYKKKPRNWQSRDRSSLCRRHPLHWGRQSRDPRDSAACRVQRHCDDNYDGEVTRSIEFEIRRDRVNHTLTLIISAAFHRRQVYEEQ